MCRSFGVHMVLRGFISKQSPSIYSLGIRCFYFSFTKLRFLRIRLTIIPKLLLGYGILDSEDFFVTQPQIQIF